MRIARSCNVELKLGKLTVEGNNKLTVSGIDKQAVGEAACGCDAGEEAGARPDHHEVVASRWLGIHPALRSHLAEPLTLVMIHRGTHAGSTLSRRLVKRRRREPLGKRPSRHARHVSDPGGRRWGVAS